LRSLKIKIEVRYNEWVQPSVVSDNANEKNTVANKARQLQTL